MNLLETRIKEAAKAIGPCGVRDPQEAVALHVALSAWRNLGKVEGEKEV